VGLGGEQSWIEAAINQESPDTLERDVANEILNVDSAIAKSSAFAVGFGDFSRECDYALQA